MLRKVWLKVAKMTGPIDRIDLSLCTLFVVIFVYAAIKSAVVWRVENTPFLTTEDERQGVELSKEMLKTAKELEKSTEPKQLNMAPPHLEHPNSTTTKSNPDNLT
ncbi:hypothetical protein ACO0LB_17880 [Undibacterium sp. SXout7W]|uniref:hypothetical protein n=1 Tax=Undibacterium sp. SXout7W TaxID=3413049 RepID=UPI003BF34E5E